ncbi:MULTISPECIES: site-specific integrase [Cytobacillus]|uniref:site-specific integrase n=1 Tax=Cytobacillus TaxID=2675230 RepID=UPI0020424CF8|nr:site-specific integrase [Cytobacillus kochii]MCM3320821.1 site-specific integrase [Cytobacillus kochii]MCM3344345.1 site-specific integrase [Cytobacillus kochii]
MNTVKPIRDLQKVAAMKEVLMNQHERNYFLFVLGINTGLRISDLLKLKVGDVRNKNHIVITEQKTGKLKRFKINNGLKRHITDFTVKKEEAEYLFKSRRGNARIHRVQAWKILNTAAKEVGLDEIGRHTLRKTFGYHFYQKYKDVAVLQQIFNHSSPSVTMRYIGINQDIIDEAVDDLVYKIVQFLIQARYM